MKDLRETIGKNYDDVLDSDKRIRIIRGMTRASKKSNTVALMCVAAVAEGKNVLCVRAKENTLRESVFASCVWAVHALELDDRLIIDEKNLTIQSPGSKLVCKPAYKIISCTDVLDLVWWEEFQQIDVRDFINMAFYTPGSFAKHICTGTTLFESYDWFEKLGRCNESKDIEVFEKSYKDNEFLCKEDRAFLDRMFKEGMDMEDVSKYAREVPMCCGRIMELEYNARDHMYTLRCDVCGMNISNTDINSLYESWAKIKLVEKIRFKEDEEMFDFGAALKKLKKGRRVARMGWNGKGMWLGLQTPDEYSKMSLPYIYMKTADNKLVPWLASQTDMLSEDWVVVW